MIPRLTPRLVMVLSVLLAAGTAAAQERPLNGAYRELVELFRHWRQFEKPPLLDGAPD